MHFCSTIKRIGFAVLLSSGLSGSQAAPMERHGTRTAARDAVPQEPGASAPFGLCVAAEAALVRSVYDRSGSTLIWSAQGQVSEQGRELLQILRAAEVFGLRPSDYAAEPIAAAAARLGSDSSAADFAGFDHSLTCAAVRLISHLHYGRIDPRAAGFELHASRQDLDIPTAVASLASSTKVAGAVSAVEPRFYHYALLKDALSRYRALAADPALTQLPGLGGRTLHAGDTYRGAPALRGLLMAEGDLTGPVGGIADTRNALDLPLAGALKLFQARHGLNADGALGAMTFAALTTPMAQRVRQIELTLERWRWLPDFRTPPIIVNIPEFRLFAFSTTADRTASILQMPVIVGQAYPGKRTPIFIGNLTSVVFRPYWDVPRSITVHEMLPAIRAHSDYLQRNHLEIVRGEGDQSPVMTPTPEAVAALAAGRLRLRQRPGDDNALGLVKFLFPNSHNVYMHSTPAPQLFSASRRAFSHGCIRVSDPTALAEYVLRHAGTLWDRGRIDAAMHDTKSSRVALREPIQVMILYGTALATENGPVQFFDDVYGHDRKLEELLGFRPVHGAAGSP